MKPFFLCIALLSSILVNAQCFELGLSGGIGSNAMLRANYVGYGTSPSNTPTFSPAIALKLLSKPRKWQIGISVDYRQLTYNNAILNEPIPAIPGFRAPPQDFSYYKESVSYFPVSLLLNRRFVFKMVELYGVFQQA